VKSEDIEELTVMGNPTYHGKSQNLRKEFSSPGKSRKMTVVMESHGIPPIGLGIF